MKKGVFFVVLAFAVVALAAAGSAVAAAGGNGHTVTQTENFHGFQQSTDVNPCTGNTVDLSETSNLVNHETFFPGDDEVWFTFTEEDKVTAVDEGTGAVYTGHSTTWGNFNLNERNSNDTFTQSIHVRAADGTSISFHEVTHETLNADGTLTVSFDKPSLTCG